MSSKSTVNCKFIGLWYRKTLNELLLAKRSLQMLVWDRRYCRRANVCPDVRRRH